MFLFGILAAVLLVGLALERYLHARARRRIPIRVHVNGIRGKSSVTRLIAAGLREGGIKTWAKVTGTLPNVVDEHGREIPIVRHSSPSIGEQRAIVMAAAARGVEAVVVECMAVQPMYQKVTEESIMQASIGVITNVRPDHLESMGTTLESIAHSLANTIPRKGVLFTTEGPMFEVLRARAAAAGTRVIQVDAGSVEDGVMDQFSYLEHKENVALALAVCEHLGVEREVAIRGMVKCRPDPGALRLADLQQGGKTFHFINALAANDPQSTFQIYQQLVEGISWQCPCLVVVNTRKDRPLRSRQMGYLMPKLAAERYYIVGDGARVAEEAAREAGVEAHRLKVIRGQALEPLMEELMASTSTEAVIFAMGNTAGLGLELGRYFGQEAAPR